MATATDPEADNGTREADIRGVARRAGVSISTVSRFLNGKKSIRPDTARRIEEAVRDLGYAPNRVAQGLRTSRTRMIGMLVPDISNPFFSSIVKGVEETLRQANYSLLLLNSSEDPEREQSNLERLNALRCDGTLLIPAPESSDETERWRHIGRLTLPVVMVDRSAPLTTDLVEVDNERGGYLAARHLIELGHRDIGLVTVNYRVSTHRDRVTGFLRALAEADIPHRVENDERVPLSVDGGRDAASRLLARPIPPTALVATSNFLTIGAMRAINRAGLSCPADISLVGYDSYTWQEAFHPLLTTIHQPGFEMGAQSAALLLERLETPVLPPRHVRLKPQLTVRASTAARP